ncbi:MAG TPA: hypothetical protein DEF39_08025 [Hungateiclostridium thermocellum]|jgi:uncharacterized protein YukE|uniref:Uncharacterized protein n=2 Tax=Acetivibrio thermocellus TaxID=1515 RepID=A3DGV9_ACET2|nr:WXG100 family type VII secretion target [Acetivibrio thermocellus]CDG36490.1 hypothetical protein CTHBC1_1869 [Acetivibrio thermocellus BC1]HPU42431.1 WXG100 family type VII secretion target [Acetivibrio clariflavus]ABN53188.1 hypothetical protein Cthe_1970 [Acetivibrio thermocellus ATCC 27405]ADU75643.1 hypothetical protein Clo1313_2644 [Acetivibrio thermocellus DSM 1313]ALX09637.1 hypothetical protein AD2_02657 [Acetivibrio thermocellus AD2]
MAGCRIVNQGMLDAISEIQRIAGEYETVADEFISSLNNAISEMEGETKDALYELINSKVKTFVYQDLPAALRGMAELLEANRQNFENTDKQLAGSISSSEG